MKYQAHLGVELPFWLALTNGQFQVRDNGEMHLLNLQNDVDRLDIGDFFSGSGVHGSTWVPRGDAEERRARLKVQHADQPITRHAMRTVITHVRTIDAPNDDSLRAIYNERRADWLKQTMRIINRFISGYMLTMGDDEESGQVGNVAPWDLAKLIVSFWEVDGEDLVIRQVTGSLEYLKPETPAPEPIRDERESALREWLASEEDEPIVDLLHYGAGAQIVRGNYRGAVADDVAALELAVSAAFRESLPAAMPAAMVEELIRRQPFDTLRVWVRELGGPDFASAPSWSSVKDIRQLRHNILHRGATATDNEAMKGHQIVGNVLRWLRK